MTLRLLSLGLLALALCSCGSAGAHRATTEFRQPLMIPVIYRGAEDYQLVDDWTVADAGLDETIPGGLVVDGASVPRLFWIFMPPDGAHRGAALFHDWAYTLQGHLRNGRVLSRREADLAFYNLSVKGGVSPRRAGIAYRSVRCFGGGAWASEEEPIILPLPRSIELQQQKQRTTLSHIFAP